ncbi:MAG: hypothetical protein AAB369_03625 [Chloroflexota bacterium]
MKLTLQVHLETELFQLEEHKKAAVFAHRLPGVVYTWKTTGRSNWLERGMSLVDSMGLVVLPAQLPAFIEMPDDQLDEED